MMGMLSPAILADPIERERIARNYWCDSSFGNTKLSFPKIGETLEMALVPYWRVWMKERVPTVKTHFGAWATVNDAIFWKNLVEHINDDVIIARGLNQAGMMGNMCAFMAASAHSVEEYAHNMFVKAVGTGPKFGYEWKQTAIVHPDVVVHMRRLGLWNQEQVSSLARAYSVDMTSYAPGMLNTDPMERGINGFTREFLQDWCLKALRHLDWTADEQSQFLGHFLQKVNRELWTDDFAAQCAPYLRPEVDVSMLKLALGFKFYDAVPESWQQMPKELGNMYNTVHNIAAGMHGHWSWTPRETDHAGVRMLMDLNPAESTMDLYRLGCQSKRMVLGQVLGQESIALPPLGM